MAGYWHVGTSFLDGRTRRNRNIVQATAVYTGSKLRDIYNTGREFVEHLGLYRQKDIRGYLRGRIGIGRHRIGYTKRRVTSAREVYYYKHGGRRRTHPRDNMPRARWDNRYRSGGRWRKGRRPRSSRPYGTRISYHRPYRTNYRTGGYMHMAGNYVPTELKFLDTELSSESFTTTWAAKNPTTKNCLNAVPEGDGESARNGRVYYVKSLHLKGVVNLPTNEALTDPQADSISRVCIVVDTQTNAAELTATEVMDGGQGKDEFAFRNLQHTKRFKVIWDKTFHIRPNIVNLGAINLFAHGNTNVAFRYNHVFKKPLKVICKSDGATVADITDNSIHVIGVADNTLVTLSYQARVRFLG